MKIFQGFNQEGPPCLICKTTADKPCILVPIYGTNEGMTFQAHAIHVECIDLVCIPDHKMIVQKYDEEPVKN